MKKCLVFALFLFSLTAHAKATRPTAVPGEFIVSVRGPKALAQLKKDVARATANLSMTPEFYAQEYMAERHNADGVV